MRALVALTIVRQMVSLLADQHMGLQTRPAATMFDGPRRQLGLDEAFAAGAGQTRADDVVHDEAPRNVFEFFRHILTDPAQSA